MNDSFGKIASPVPPSARGGIGRGGQLVQIVTLPDSLTNNAKAIRLEGEITKLNNNGTVRIETGRGEIEVRIKGNRQPQKGQRIEIELPAGRPPKQGTIRDSRSQDANIQTQRRGATPPPQQNTPVVTNDTQTARSTRTTQPLPPNVQEAVAQNGTKNNANAQSRPLTTQATVRLLSVPPAQAQTIAAEYTQTLPPAEANTLTRVAFSANLTAQNAQNQLSETLLQALKGEAPIPVTLKNNPVLQTSSAPKISLVPPNSAPATTFLTITPATQTIPAGQTFPTNNIANILQAPQAQAAATIGNTAAPQTGTLTPVPITFDPLNPTSLMASRFQKIDIQVIKITPPIPNITATTAGNVPPTSPLPAATQFIPPLTSANNATTITAQVTGFTQGGLPLVTAQWPGSPLPQSFILQFNSNNLQLGSQLQIIPKTSAMPVMPINPTQANTMNTLLQGFQWPALDELYNTLLQISPQAASALSRSLPNAGHPSQMGAAAAMFVAAVKSGDLGSFFGDKKIDLIQRAGRADILSKLTQSAPSTAATTEPASSTEWKAVPLPIFWEGEIHKITLFTRSENQNQTQDNEGNTQTRFVFDLSLSRMGDVQLDGLLRDKRLDLMVRTQNGFSAPMQQTMRQAYSTALGHTDLSGDLNFQGTTKNWVHVLEKKEQLGVNV